MARTKGALNKRTRAALHEAESGDFEVGGKTTIQYLLKIVTDTKKDEGTRMRAADIVLPYLRPKLSAVETTNINEDDLVDEDQITQAIAALVAQRPELVDHFIALRGPKEKVLSGPGPED